MILVIDDALSNGMEQINALYKKGGSHSLRTIIINIPIYHNILR